ncbi:DeoR/GlpR family DNA-binding transcription regulator [Deinococcus metallilatus]|nr:DeoR/GlpR family DNA-binding transcription regulator [Deinococcus metallilatus]MBB5293469.1 DeoR family transcriptional regulator of aga operon [Deinococcus metallilatus]GMA15311.1 GntR family transcriptional regulator [Deinococcus metallilatus]
MDVTSSLLPAERQGQVLALVQERGSATVHELSRELGASISTVRRDLDLLAQQGLIARTHGGAIAKTHTASETRFDERQRENADEKRRIGQHALTLLEPNQSVYFDSSTTVMAAAEALRAEPIPLTAITHDIAIAAVLATLPQVHVMLPGGEIRAGSFTLVGATTHTFLRHLHVDVALIGIHAIRDGQLSEGSLPVAELKSALLGTTNRRVLLADHSKFGQTALIDVAPLGAVQDLITGQETPRQVLDHLELTQNLRVHTV